MRTLSIDLETYSDVDIRSRGIHKYVSSPAFEVLLFGYAYDDEPVTVLDLTEQGLPDDIISALYDADVQKTAFNAAFEITCLREIPELFDMPAEQWECSSVLARYNGLPGSLEGTAKALKLSADAQKDTRGKNLIRYFSTPCAPTKANGGRTRNMPSDNPEKWQEYIEYNRQDVVVERAIREKLVAHMPPEEERQLWLVDLAINATGVRVDESFVRKAIDISTDYTTRLIAEAQELTGLNNPNSVIQLKEWITGRTGEEIESLKKDSVSALLAQDIPADVKRVLRIRQLLGKSSVKKYEAMKGCAVKHSSTYRCHDLFQFYGANRTGRWAGRMVQLQNLPRNSLPDLDTARELVKNGDTDTLDLLYSSVPDVLSQLIRTAIVAEEGHLLYVADFSAIEARVIAWLAGETWRLDTFRSGGDIYCASASSMFGVPVEKHGVNGHLRQKGKVAELALGYGGGPGALIAMGALEQGLTEEELPDMVTSWRSASPRICKFWYDCDSAAKQAIKTGGTATIKQGRIGFEKTKGTLLIHLPSGRDLTYIRPGIGTNRFGGESITYLGTEQVSRRWARLETYGGKLVENIVQAVARDCLAAALMRLYKAGYRTVGHVHDEVIIDDPGKDPDATLQDIIRILCKPTDWNKGLPLSADGFYSTYYKKD